MMWLSQGVLVHAIVLGIILPTVTAATCTGRIINETTICQNVNSTGVIAQLPVVVSGNLSQYSCANASSLLALNSNNILSILKNASVSTNTSADPFILFFSRINGTALETALETWDNQTADTSVVPSKDLFLLALWETKLRNATQYNQTAFVEVWFQVRLRPFLSAVPTNILQCLHNASMGCQQYQAILKGLNMVFNPMTPETRSSVYSSLVFPYLQTINSTNSPGSVCTDSLNNSSAWLMINFGNFSTYAAYKDLTSLNVNFSGFDVLELLTSTQLADLTVDSGATMSSPRITAIFDSMKNRSLADLTQYYTEFNARNVSAQNLTAAPTMLNKTLELLFPKLTNFMTQDYADWFQSRLLNLLPSLTSAQATQIFSNVSCDSYQAVVKGLDSAYPRMTAETQQGIYGALNDYLINHATSGFACLNGSNNRDWLLINFGQFRRFGLFQDFTRGNKNFTGLDALDILTVKQLAQLSATNGTLKTPGDVQKVMGYVNSSVIAEYMDEFNKKSNIALPDAVRSELLFQVLNASAPERANEMEFGKWMSPRLSYLLPGLNSSSVTLLYQVLTSSNCSALCNLTCQLSSSNSQFSNTTQRAIYNAILGLAKDPSLPCYNSSCSFAKYLEETFQGYSTFLNLGDAFSGVPSARIPKIVNSMTPLEFVHMFRSSDFINDNSLLIALLTNYNSKSSFIDEFNKSNVVNTLSNKTKAAILEGVWPAVVNSTNEADLDMWLGSRLQPYFLLISKDLLKPSAMQNATCLSFSKIVNKLGTNLKDFKGQEQDFYSSIKTYLSAGASGVPRCYSTSDSAWFVTYLGPFIRYSSVDDIQAMVPNNSILQILVTDKKNLDLISSTMIPDDVARLYASALFAKEPNFDIRSLPDQLLCFAKDSAAIKNQMYDQLLQIIKRINANCRADPQLASVLVGHLLSLNSGNLKDLGQQAVGLTTGQITNMSNADVQNSIEDLGKVKGWDAGQAQGLVNKLLASNISFSTPDSFVQLGSLVSAMPSRVFSSMPREVARNLTNNAQFVSSIANAPVYLQEAFVGKVCSPSTDCVNNVPDSLAGAIPNSLLIFGKNIPDIKSLSKKQWTKDQAMILFGNLVNGDSANFTDFSASVLQGSQCHSVSRLNSNNFVSLVSKMKSTQTILDASQLDCLAKLSKKNSVDYEVLPADVLLFYDTNSVKGNCKDFFTQASQGNINNLAQNPVQLDRVLKRSSSCLSINSFALSADQLRSLGGLVCYMDPAVISASDPQVVENLKQCQNLQDSQQRELVKVLNSGKTQYGAPSSWNFGTLNKLGSLPFFMNKDIFSNLNTNFKTGFFRNVVGGFKTQNIPRGKIQKFITSFLSSVSSQRKRRGAGCNAGNITATSLKDPLFLLTYPSAEEFDRCLDDDVLQQNLAAFAEQPLPDSYLEVMKARLDKIYPQGLPEDQIKLLGSALSRLYTGADISKWNITSSDTLNILMVPDDPRWNETQAKAILTRYLQSGNTLTGPILKNIGGEYLCTLDVAQISSISADSLKDAGRLDISTCSQDKKDILYPIAKEAFSSAMNSNSYYSLIQPYLGGARAADLKSLAQSNVSMDIQTFMGLKTSELLQLSVPDVKNLLGINIDDLKTYQNDAPVSNWIKQQIQSDLDSLGLGLTGGIATLPAGYIIIQVTSGAVPSVYSLQTVVLTLGISAFRRFL